MSLNILVMEELNNFNEFMTLSLIEVFCDNQQSVFSTSMHSVSIKFYSYIFNAW